MKRENEEIYNQLINAGVQQTPPLLNDNIFLNFGAQQHAVKVHYESYLQLFIQNNSIGPIEKHPYIDRFSEDFDLEREFLIFGTMSPSSYFNHLELNGLPNTNINHDAPIDYYYGNMASLWEYLQFGNNLTVQEIRQSLMERSISITDVFYFAQRMKMRSAKDEDLYNLVLNDRVLHLFTKSTSKIKTILTTSGSLKDLHGNDEDVVNVSKAVKWIIEEYGNLDDYSISGEISGDGQYFSLNNQGVQNACRQQNGGIVWWLKKGERKVSIINLPSPSGYANQIIFKTEFFKSWINYKADQHNEPRPNQAQLLKLKDYMSEYPAVFELRPTKQYRREVYQMALNGTLSEIYQVNNFNP